MDKGTHKSKLPIPPLFCKSDVKTPFDSCQMCSCSLDNKRYLIEKAIRNYASLNTSEVIFEYAMCLECAGKMRMELSTESRSNIEKYFLNNVNQSEFQNRMGNTSTDDVNKLVSKCIVKNTDINDAREYSIYALCEGNQIVLGELPYALSGECMDEMTELLSAKSLDILDDFIGNHFSGPPEVMDILKRRPLLV